jgi:hypothetical protein
MGGDCDRNSQYAGRKPLDAFRKLGFAESNFRQI